MTCMNLTSEAASDKKLGEKRKTQTKGTEEINAQSSLAIVTGLSQLTMVDRRKKRTVDKRGREKERERERV